MAIEPEKCPECVGPPVVVQRIDDRADEWLSGCAQAFMRRAPDEPECPVKPATAGCRSRDEAIDAWNAWVSRGTPAAAPAAEEV